MVGTGGEPTAIERRQVIMTSLSKLTDGELTEFKRRLAKAGLKAEMVRKANVTDGLAEAMVEALKAHPIFRLIHGRFNSLEDKLALVCGWPGVTEEMVQAALEEGKERIALFERESPANSLLDIVVSVYLPTAYGTFSYARDRMRETFGEEFWQWEDAYAEISPDRVRWLDGVAVPLPGVRIEVVDLGANFDSENGMVPAEKRGPHSAHAAVIYAAAQDPEWIQQMDGASVPYAIAAGLELDIPGYDRWSDSPFVHRDGDGARLNADHVGDGYHRTALPSLREC
ncbi:MAG: hypothetical protein V1738_00560 [Patescibacteria group bacterium]